MTLYKIGPETFVNFCEIGRKDWVKQYRLLTLPDNLLLGYPLGN